MSLSAYMVWLLMSILAMAVVSQITLIQDMLVAAGVNQGNFFIGGIMLLALLITIMFAVTQK
jgi:uncharacterized membrane protein